MTCGTTLFGVAVDGAIDGMAEAAEDPGSDDGNSMSPVRYSEATLVPETTAEYLEERLRWHSVYAYSTETFGPDGTLGRTAEDEVVLTRYLRQALVSLNPGVPGEAVDNAIGAIGVPELWIKGPVYRRRAELIGFVNGIPLLFMELKNIHRNVRRAYENWIRLPMARFLCNTSMFGKLGAPSASDIHCACLTAEGGRGQSGRRRGQAR